MDARGAVNVLCLRGVLGGGRGQQPVPPFDVFSVTALHLSATIG